MRAQVGYGAFLFLIMDRRKALALVGKSVKETGRFGKMTPHLDGDYDPQLWVLSGKYGDVLYLVRAEYEDLKLYVFLDIGGWKAVPSSSFDKIIRDGFWDENNELERIVKAVNKDTK